jgi:hypothetical protein
LAIREIRPNPVTREAAVRLALPSSAPATLALLDVAGRRVLTRALEHPAAGPAEVRLAAPGALRAGVYWLKLTQAGCSASRRLVVVR